jgi:hypothetical protein
MTTDEFARLAVLEEKVKSNDLQVRRMISHLESEQRVSGNHEKRIDTIERAAERLQKQADKYEAVLYNTGKGLIMDVKELQHSKKEARNLWRDIMAVSSFLLALALSLKEIIK